MKKSIFISRELNSDSKLLSFLNENDWHVEHQSLIKIEPITFEIKSDYDWVFISSSNGAKILFQSYSPSDECKIGVVGEVTAKAVKNLGYFPDFIGDTGNMKDLGDRLARTIGTQSVLFVGAAGGSEKIRLAIPSAQRNFIPIYRTTLLSGKVPDTEVVFLTSPSNAKSYLNSANLKGKKVMAIGQTTADFLKVQGLRNIFVPATPKEIDVIELLKSF